MENFLKSILTTISERIKNIFVSTFALSWIVWNWKYFYITLFVSENSVKAPSINKFEYITSINTDICVLLIYPLITAILYIFIITYLNVQIGRFISWCKLKAKTYRINIWESEVFSRDDLNEEVKSYKESIKKQKLEINELNENFKDVNELSESYKENIIQLNEDKKVLIESNKKLKKDAPDSILDIKTLGKIIGNKILINKLNNNDFLKRLEMGFEKSVLNEKFTDDELNLLIDLELIIKNKDDIYKVDKNQLENYINIINVYDNNNSKSFEIFTKNTPTSLLNKEFSNEEIVDFKQFNKLLTKLNDEKTVNWLIKNTNEKPFEASKIRVKHVELYNFLIGNKYIKVIKSGYVNFTKEYIKFIIRFSQYYSNEENNFLSQ